MIELNKSYVGSSQRVDSATTRKNSWQKWPYRYVRLVLGDGSPDISDVTRTMTADTAERLGKALIAEAKHVKAIGR